MEVLLKPIIRMDTGFQPHVWCSNVKIILVHIISGSAYLLFLQTHSTLPGHFELFPGQYLWRLHRSEPPYLLVCLADQSPMPRRLANILDHILSCFIVFLIVNLKSEALTLLQNS